MSDSPSARTWTVGSIEIQRIPYFDTPLPAESIDLEDVAASIDWAEPWMSLGQPAVGQAFWVLRGGGRTIVVDPCGASDDFLRAGPDAVGHQDAAFALLVAAGCDPDAVDAVVLTHLDGIGMAAMADGAPAGEETWTPAFPRADLVVSRAEYDHIMAGTADPPGLVAFAQLDALGAVRAVDTPHELAPGVTLRLTGGHSPGHCCVDVDSDGDRAVLLGHLAVSPLHAAGVSVLHLDRDRAREELTAILDDAAANAVLVAGSLWPSPGAATVTGADSHVLTPSPGA